MLLKIKLENSKYNNFSQKKNYQNENKTSKTMKFEHFEPSISLLLPPPFP